jgi:hypothetical protein
MADSFVPAGQGQQGQQGQQSASQGQAGGNSGQSQGQNPEYVTKADFDAIVTKLDEVLADNARYRSERRQGRQQGNSGEGSQQGNRNGDSGSSADNQTANELATMKAQLRTANFRNDITAAATRANAIIPERIWRLLDIEEAGADDLGYVKDADKVIASLKKEAPQLFGATTQGSANGGNGSNQGNTDPNDMNAILRRDIRRARGG